MRSLRGFPVSSIPYIPASHALFPSVYLRQRLSWDPAEFHLLRRRPTQSVVGLLVVTTTGVVGYRIFGGPEYTLVDAIYMTVITLTTVGFGEVIDMSANPAGRVFTIALLVGGMGVVAYAVPMVAQFILEEHLNHA